MPLNRTVRNGYSGVVKKLLERDDVKPNNAAEDNPASLFQDSSREDELTVEMLLKRDDVNPNKPDNTAQTPLTSSAKSVNLGVLETLLERSDVTDDKPKIREVLISGISCMYRN